jgi:hypothetical protein
MVSRVKNYYYVLVENKLDNMASRLANSYSMPYWNK